MSDDADQLKSLERFHAGVAAAVQAKADLVNAALGGAFWPADGAFREQLVRDALAQCVPHGIQVGHGFGTDHKSQTKQIDVMVFGTDLLAPLFRDRDFYLVHPSTLVAAVEVKRRLASAAEIAEVATTLEATCSLHRAKFKLAQPFPLLTGLVAFDCEPTLETVVRRIAEDYTSRVKSTRGVHEVRFDELPLSPVLLDKWLGLQPQPNIVVVLPRERPPWTLGFWFDDIGGRWAPVAVHFDPVVHHGAGGTSYLGLAHLMTLLANQCLDYKAIHWQTPTGAHSRAVGGLLASSASSANRVATYSLLPESWFGGKQPKDVKFVH